MASRLIKLLSGACWLPIQNPESDGQDFWLNNEVALAHQHFWITPEEQNEQQPRVDPECGCVLTCAARLDNRPELIHTLGLEQAGNTPSAMRS